MNKTVTTVLIVLLVVLGGIVAYDHFGKSPSNDVINPTPPNPNPYDPSQNQTNGGGPLPSNGGSSNNTPTTNNQPLTVSDTEKNSSDYGSITVEVNGESTTFSASSPFDAKGSYSGAWTAMLFKRMSSMDKNSLYLSLPSDVKAGDKFTLDDARITMESYGPPQFDLQYIDNNAMRYMLSDGNSFDSFTLIVDQWDGRGGWAAGRFAGELRPYGGDTVIFNNGSFKIKIRS